MASVRDLRKRIKSVKNTQKITKAMKMVAASKLRRAQQQIVGSRPYAIKMDQVLKRVVERTDEAVDHPLVAVREVKRVELLVLTSNRGLCGSFNSNILRSAEEFLQKNAKSYEQIKISVIGRKGAEYFARRGIEVVAQYKNISDSPTFQQASEIAVDLADRFKEGNVDSIILLYNEFKSAISQKVSLYSLLPVRPIGDWVSEASVRVGEMAAAPGGIKTVAGKQHDVEHVRHTSESWPQDHAAYENTIGFEHLYEPSREGVLSALLPQHLAVQVWRALLESTAAEHGARMSAMDAASRNAKEVIERLTINMNRARQAAITTELVEIVSGAQALEN